MRTLDERGKLHLLDFCLNIKVIQHGRKKQGIDIHGRANNSSLVNPLYNCMIKVLLSLANKTQMQRKQFYLVL